MGTDNARVTYAEPTPTGQAGFVRCFVACTLVFTSVLFFNGALGQGVGNTTEADVVQTARDWSCVAGIAAFLCLAAAGMRRPQALRPHAFTLAAALLTLLGHAMALAAQSGAPDCLVVAGACASGIGTAWTTLLLLVACSALDLRAVCACLAGASALAIPIAMGVGALCASVNGTIDETFRNLADLAASLGALAAASPAAMPFFSRLENAGAPRDHEISHPGAFLPFGHQLFVFILAFSFAYGFAMRTVALANRTVPYALTAVVLLGVALWALRHKARPKADALFQLSFAFIVGGFALVLVRDTWTGAVSSALLVCGYMCFYLLMWFTLCAVANRSTLDAIPAICWGNAISYLGILAGAALGAATGSLPGGNLAAQVCVAGVLTGMATYMVHAFHSTSLDAAIDGIEPDAAPLEVRYVDKLAQRCEEETAQAGLTQREGEILLLLARGNNAQHIQDELSISHNTVKFHARNIYRKLDVHSQQELIDLLCSAE